MNAVQAAQKILIDAQLEIDHVYINIIPKNVQDDSEFTDVLVTDVVESYGNYGSDKSTTLDETIALNIFYGLNTDTNAELLEDAIVSIFEQRGWSCIYSTGYTIDPDTNQLTKIMHFKRTKERG
ncbi:DUF806 family protein [Lactobacillus acetotolerans]|uniref:DUF806 family protein n=1 Tax=Lactobacillus acetotolerans TaxID=1600 RepID=UPI002FD9ADE1